MMSKNDGLVITKSSPIDIPKSSNFSNRMNDSYKRTPTKYIPINNNENPYLISWKSSLEKKIIEKENELIRIEKDIDNLVKTSEKQKDEVDLLYNSISKILKQTDVNINNFCDNIKKKIDDNKNKTEEVLNNINDKGKIIETKGNNLFLLFKDMYKEASNFFSKKEFESKKSTLSKKDNTWLSYFSEADYAYEQKEWLEWLSPIWTMEEHYKHSLNEFKIANKKYDIYKKKLENKKESFEKIKKELSLLNKEILALENFSDTITKISLSTPNSYSSNLSDDSNFSNY
jgi:hypothetical protein